jgi:hypothetical protein
MAWASPAERQILVLGLRPTDARGRRAICAARSCHLRIDHRDVVPLKLEQSAPVRRGGYYGQARAFGELAGDAGMIDVIAIDDRDRGCTAAERAATQPVTVQRHPTAAALPARTAHKATRQAHSLTFSRGSGRLFGRAGVGARSAASDRDARS